MLLAVGIQCQEAEVAYGNGYGSSETGMGEGGKKGSGRLGGKKGLVNYLDVLRQGSGAGGAGGSVLTSKLDRSLRLSSSLLVARARAPGPVSVYP